MTVNYGYCVWLTSNTVKELDLIANNFQPHISIFTHLSLNDAKNLYNLLIKDSKDKNIFVKLSDKSIATNTNGFCCLEYGVDYICYDENNSTPSWWPKNAHISLKYKYDEDITLDEINEVERKLESRIFNFTKLKIMLCKGHHNDWREITM
jgi:hypothetical protein